MTAADSEPIAIGRDDGTARIRFSPLRTGVANRLILVAMLTAILWTAIALVIGS
jgi:hypothetical protein